ncbi:protein MKS [Salix suchowensis]|nr:protein MKS [Salix suchowensis]
MDPNRYPTTGKPPPPPRKPIQIQGVRPSALKIHQDSHKIKKQPPPPPKEPVIIYAVSPKIIHTEESNFMSVVQRLTGLSSDNFFHDGSVSPAARLAATEKASPRELARPSTTHDSSNDDLMELLKDMDVGQFPGILSPAPAMLPPTLLDPNSIDGGYFRNWHEFKPGKSARNWKQQHPFKIPIRSQQEISVKLPFGIIGTNAVAFEASRPG